MLALELQLDVQLLGRWLGPPRPDGETWAEATSWTWTLSRAERGAMSNLSQQTSRPPETEMRREITTRLAAISTFSTPRISWTGPSAYLFCPARLVEN